MLNVVEIPSNKSSRYVCSVVRLISDSLQPSLHGNYHSVEAVAAVYNFNIVNLPSWLLKFIFKGKILKLKVYVVLNSRHTHGWYHIITS